MFEFAVEFGAGVVCSEFFLVAVPEFVMTVAEGFDEDVGVVVFELGDPSHFVEEIGFFAGDCLFGSGWEDVGLGVGGDFHLYFRLWGIRWVRSFVTRIGDWFNVLES